MLVIVYSNDELQYNLCSFDSIGGVVLTTT